MDEFMKVRLLACASPRMHAPSLTVPGSQHGAGAGRGPSRERGASSWQKDRKQAAGRSYSDRWGCCTRLGVAGLPPVCDPRFRCLRICQPTLTLPCLCRRTCGAGVPGAGRRMPRSRVPAAAPHLAHVVSTAGQYPRAATWSSPHGPAAPPLAATGAAATQMGQQQGRSQGRPPARCLAAPPLPLPAAASA